MDINLKRWFLIVTVCVLGWVSGFAIYWMIAPTILPIINTEINQQSAQDNIRESMQKPAMTIHPAQAGLREAVFHSPSSHYRTARSYYL